MKWKESNANFIYYMANSLLAGKMNQILRSDWLPERARWRYLASSGLPAVSRKKNFPERLIINPLLTKLDSQDRCILASFFFFFRVFMGFDSVSVHKHVKTDLVNFQRPSWPQAWSIMNPHVVVCDIVRWWSYRIYRQIQHRVVKLPQFLARPVFLVLQYIQSHPER